MLSLKLSTYKGYDCCKFAYTTTDLVQVMYIWIDKLLEILWVKLMMTKYKVVTAI